MGLDLSPEGKMILENAAQEEGIPLLSARSVKEMTEVKMALIRSEKPRLLVSIGGSASTLSGSESEVLQGGFFLPGSAGNEKTAEGVIMAALGSGIPVLHFLGLRRLAGEAGIPYDGVPVAMFLQNRGKSGICFRPGLFLSVSFSPSPVEKGPVMKENSPLKHLAAGAFFLLIWAALQQVSAAPVLHAIARVPESMDSGDLLAAASFVVLLNSLRAIALYLGWFLAGNGFASLRISLAPLSWLLPAAAIPLTYVLLPAVGEGIQLHFGIPAVLSVTSVLVIRYLTRSIPDWINKSIALSLFVFSFQWLDIIPCLTAYGAGWGTFLLCKNSGGTSGKGVGPELVGRCCLCRSIPSGVITTELMV